MKDLFVRFLRKLLSLLGEDLSRMEFELVDGSDERHRKQSQRGHVTNEHGSLWVHFEGYGDASSDDGDGVPAAFEYFDGKLRGLFWTDIFSEDCDVIVELEGASESRRPKEGGSALEDHAVRHH